MFIDCCFLLPLILIRMRYQRYYEVKLSSQGIIQRPHCTFSTCLFRNCPSSHSHAWDILALVTARVYTTECFYHLEPSRIQSSLLPTFNRPSQKLQLLCIPRNSTIHVVGSLPIGRSPRLTLSFAHARVADGSMFVLTFTKIGSAPSRRVAMVDPSRPIRYHCQVTMASRNN
jgi:hypothetical protein